jgi:hypothetical protein
MKKISSWYNIELIKEKTRGFVYLIVNTLNKKLYIGKKKTVTERRVPVAGRVNKKRVVTSSNWKNYYGSSKELKADIAKYGKENFQRFILGAFDELHSTNYAEADLQFMMNVLCEEGDYKFYNKNIKITAMRCPAHREYIGVMKGILERI